MKKLSTLVMACLVPVLLAACDRGDDPAADQGQKPDPTTRAPTAAPSPVSRFATLEVPDEAAMLRVPCALDKINTQPAAGQVTNLEAGAQARFSGWVSDASRKVPSGFKITLKGEAATYVADAKADRGRPDVARALNAPALANAGFNSVASLAGVAPGRYDVGLLIEGAGKSAYCRTTARVEVVGSPD